MHSASNMQLLRQQLAIQEILRQQQIELQLKNAALLPRPEVQNEVLNEWIRRNRTILELEKLKQMIDKVGPPNDGLLGLFTNPLTNATFAPKSKRQMGPLLDWKSLLQQQKSTVQGSSEQQVTKPDSPHSDVSSGFGTLTSPLSECDVTLNLTTPSPQFDFSLAPSLTQEKVSDPPLLENQPVLAISYQGRNLLDLTYNLRHQWAFQMAVLPQHTAATEAQYRSVYHRLGPFGTQNFATDKCRECGFVDVQYVQHPMITK